MRKVVPEDLLRDHEDHDLKSILILRTCLQAFSNQNLMILREFDYWENFFVSYENNARKRFMATMNSVFLPGQSAFPPTSTVNRQNIPTKISVCIILIFIKCNPLQRQRYRFNVVSMVAYPVWMECDMCIWSISCLLAL